MTPKERAAMDARLKESAESRDPLVAGLANLNLSVLALHDRVVALESAAGKGAPVGPDDALGILERLARLDRVASDLSLWISMVATALDRMAGATSGVIMGHDARLDSIERRLSRLDGIEPK
jgi:hypothetical protein